MKKDNYPADIIHQFEHIVETCRHDDSLLEFVDKINMLLTEEQRLSIWERNGGCRHGGRNREAISFQSEHADKTLADKLALLKKVRPLGRFRRNGDGTITEMETAATSVF